MPYRCNLGFSLVEIIIGLGLIGVVIMVMMTVFNNFFQKMHSLGRKQDVLELKAQMLQHLNRPEVCTWQLRDKVIDVSMAPTLASPSPSVVSLSDDTIYLGLNNSSAVMARRGERVPASTSNLSVAAVSFRNIYSTGVINEYRGQFEVIFAQDHGDYSLKPAVMNQTIRVVASDPPNAKRIAYCYGSASADSGSGILANIATFELPGSHTWVAPDGVTRIQVEVWAGGGGGCGKSGGAGGGGGYSVCVLNVVSGETYQMEVGAAGVAAGNDPACLNNHGGDSIFQGPSECSASGGRSGSSIGGAGGNGTTTSGPGLLMSLNLRGGNGTDLGACTNAGVVARGGAAPRGGDGGAGAMGCITIEPAVAPGGGGASSCWEAIGYSGDGAPGAIHIRW